MTPRGYLGALSTGVTLVLAAQYLLPGRAWGAVGPIDVVAVVCTGLALLLWLRTPRQRHLGWGQQVFLVGSLVALIWIAALTTTRLTYAEPVWLLAGALLVFSLTKPPDATDARFAIDLLLAGVLTICLLALVLEVSGVRESWYLDGSPLAAWERQQYWLPLADVLGLDGRWAGPFDHPGRSGQVGAVVLVWGLASRGRRRLLFTVAGALVILLAGSSTAYLAAGAGVAVLAIFGLLPQVRGLPRWAPGLVAVIGFAALALVIVGPNSHLSGRTDIWPIYVDLWSSAPWTGVGTDGITEALRAQVLPRWAYHAHDSWLDLLTRHGLPALLAAVAATVAGLSAAWSVAQRGRPAALGLMAALLTASITQPILGWLFPSVTFALLVLAVLLATPAASASRR